MVLEFTPGARAKVCFVVGRFCASYVAEHIYCAAGHLKF